MASASAAGEAAEPTLQYEVRKKMIREATPEDAARIAEIDVFSSRYAYRNMVPEECLYQDLTVENRIPVHRRWIAEKRFGVYVYEDPATGIIRGMMGVGAGPVFLQAAETMNRNLTGRERMKR